MVQKKIRQLGNVLGNENKRKNPNRGRVYDQRFIAPTLVTCTGGGLQPYIIVKKRKNK